MQLLGSKNIENTFYTQLIKFKKGGGFYSATAKTTEAKRLVEDCYNMCAQYLRRLCIHKTQAISPFV